MSARPARTRDSYARAERFEVLEHLARHLTAGLLVAAGFFVFFGSTNAGSAATRVESSVQRFSSGNLHDMEVRVSALEIQNQRLKQLGAFLLVLFGAGLSVRRLLPLHTLEANRLILRDGRGRLRVGLTPDAGLVMLDRNQRPRVELSAIRDGAALKLFDPTRKRRVELTELSDGAVLAISDCSQHPRAALLGVSQDGPSLSLVDGKAVGTMAIGSDGPNLVLLDRDRGRSSLQVTDDGPELVLSDIDSNPVAVVGNQRRSVNGAIYPARLVATA